MQNTVKYAKLCKDLMVKDLEKRFKTNPNFIVTEYGSVGVNDINSFRRKAEKANFSYVVVKNRLCRVVLETIDKKEMLEHVGAQCGIAFLGDDIVEGTKIVLDFSKDQEPFNIKVGYIEGKVVGFEKIKELASLPSRDMLLSILVGTLQAPISGFVRVLGGVTRKFVYAIQALKEKKEKE